MRRDRSRQGALWLALLAGACAFGVTWLESAPLAPGVRAAAPEEGRGRAVAVRPAAPAEVEEGSTAPAEGAAPERLPAAAPASEAPAPAASEPARVEVALLDQAGRPVLPALVVLRAEDGSGSERALAIGADGDAARFEVPPGVYRALAREESLPEGWLAPWGQEQDCAAAGEPAERPGFLARRVAVGAGGSARVALRAFRAARVEGRVLAPSGEPAAGIGVRLASAVVEGLLCDARTDADGRFALESLYPGAYTLQARPCQARRADERWLPDTVPLAVEIAEGETLALDDLRLRAGTRELAGRLVDEEGRALAEILVTVGPSPRSDDLRPAWPPVSARTGQDGGFLLADLPGESVLLRIDFEARLDPARAGAPPDPILVELGGEEARVDLGLLRVPVGR